MLLWFYNKDDQSLGEHKATKLNNIFGGCDGKREMHLFPRKGQKQSSVFGCEKFNIFDHVQHQSLQAP